MQDHDLEHTQIQLTDALPESFKAYDTAVQRADEELQRIILGESQMSNTPNQSTSLPTPATAENASDKSQGSPIAPGVYLMKATDADLGMTTGSAESPPAPQVGVLLEFVDGPYVGTSLTWYGYFTDKTKAGTFRALRTLGWQGDDLSDLSSCRGQAPCTIQVEPDLEGTPRARVRFIGGGAIAMKTTMNPDQKQAFALSMKAFASTIKAPEPAKSSAQPPASGNQSPPSSGGGGGPVGGTGPRFF